MRGRGRCAGVVFFFSFGLATAGGARAEEPPDENPRAAERVPIAANFSVAERATIVTAATLGVLAMVGLPAVTLPDAPSLGPPAPGSFDRDISERLYRGGDGRFLARVPDVAGLFVLPYLPALFYGTQTFVRSRTGRPLFTHGDVNPDHRLWAYIEAIGWTALLTGVTKVTVGRERPYVVLDHPELAAPTSERNLSFFSGHAAASFCAASFVALDFSDTLRAGALRRAGPVRRFLLGTLAPYTAAFGVAGLVGFSRIVDQQHWASDVITGAAVGTAAGHLAYIAHFDTDGLPRRRLGEDALGAPGALALAPVPGGVALRGLLP